MQEFDVIVVGAGVAGGLPAAAYLQRAGLSVALVEERDRTASFFSSYERAPGVRFDVAPVNFSCMAPALADLDLAAHGYRIDQPAVLHATLDGSGRATTMYVDQARTVAALARYSARDAARFAELMTALRSRAREILALAIYTPEPDLGRALELTAEAVGLPAERLWELNGPEVVELLFEDDAVRVALTALPAINLFGELLVPGEGAMAWLWSFLLSSCRAPAGSSSLPAALERAFLEHGGTLLLNAAAQGFVLDDDGVCRGVRVQRGRQRDVLVARSAVISNLGAHLSSELLGREIRPGWRSAGRTVFTADLVLDRPLAWPEESFHAAQRVYLVWKDWNDCKAWLQAAREEREEVFLGHLELTQSSVLYGTGPAGAPLRVRFGTGPFLDEDWPSRLGFYEQALRERIAELDPGVRIRSLDMATPLDYWRMNAAARFGNPVGGDFGEGQWMHDRLPYRSDVPGLYFSNSVWPTSMSWMAPGYNAACAVAADLGVRDLPWWSAPPLPPLTRSETLGAGI